MMSRKDVSPANFNFISGAFFWLTDDELPIDMRRPPLPDNALKLGKTSWAVTGFSIKWLFPIILDVLRHYYLAAQKRQINRKTMSLIIDKQTLDDLNIFGKRDNDAVYAIFNRTYTRGGAAVLEQMFRYPLANLERYQKEVESFNIFFLHQTAFPFQGELFDAAESYLSDTDERSRLSAQNNTLGRKFNQVIGADTAYQQLLKGITSIIEIFILLQQFIETAGREVQQTAYATEMQAVQGILAQPPFEPAAERKDAGQDRL